MVRRAAIMFLPRAPKKEVRKYLAEFSRHPDSGISRLAQYLLQLCSDTDYALQELSRLRNSNSSDNALIRRMYQLYAASASEKSEIAKKVFETTMILDRSESVKIRWHRDQIRARTSWSQVGGRRCPPIVT